MSHIRRIAPPVLAIALALTPVLSQTKPGQKPAFEVVAIKAAPQPTPELIRSGYAIAFDIDAARVRIAGFPLTALLARAFRVELPQVNAPDFARNQIFEIQATLPAGATREQVPEMLQAMLAERFKLAYHRETREYQMSVLTVGKSGMKLPRLPDGNQPPPSTSTRLSDGSTRIEISFPSALSLHFQQRADQLVPFWTLALAQVAPSAP